MLARLTLTDFRNHAALDLAPGAGFVVLVGDNGAGKTNVLEAVSLLAPGRGLRRARLSEMARQDGPGGFAVAAVLARDGTRIGTGAEAAAPERRIVRVNGAAAPATQLPERLTVLWLTPAMDRLFAAAASDRRRFLDRLTLALTPDHALHAARYEAAMRDRNRLLAEEALPDPDWLAALEAQMAEHGEAIDAARRRTVRLLDTRLADGPDTGFPRAAIALASDAIEGGLAEALRRSRARDALAGRTLVGPHRADLHVRHVAKDQPAERCSTGEQKALLLGIVIAHAELVAAQRGQAPVLLLDEVAAHLDPARREALFGRLDGLGQTWMTGTEASLFSQVGGDSTLVELPLR